MGRVGVDPAPWEDAAEARRADGAGVMLVAVDGQLAGLLAVADPIRESARGAFDALRSDGLRIVMLTGDNAPTANAVARIVGGLDQEIGRASWWERVCHSGSILVVAVALKTKKLRITKAKETE